MGFRDGQCIMAGEPPDIRASIVELQALLLGTESIDGFLRELAVLAARTLGAGLSCGITLQPNGRPLTVASSDGFASQVDELQYKLDEGPCLITHGNPVGALNLYSRQAGFFGEVQSQQAERFARDASTAVGIAAHIAQQAVLTEQLRESLASRAVIDQAVGVLMAEQRCGVTEAFEILRAASQNRNIKLRQVAEDIVTRITGRPPQPPPFEPPG